MAPSFITDLTSIRNYIVFNRTESERNIFIFHNSGLVCYVWVTVAAPRFGARRGTKVTGCLHKATVDI